MMATNASLIDFMKESLDLIQSKEAESNTEAGGYSGGSTHPSASEPDGTQDAPTGARHAETASDVKSDQGPPAVDATEGANEDDMQYNIGINQDATGEDASTEDPDKINKKDDDGYKETTSHPASGQKEQGSKQALWKAAGDLGNKLLANIAVMQAGDTEKVAEGEKAEEAENPAEDNKHNYEADDSTAKKKADNSETKTPDDEKSEDESMKEASADPKHQKDFDAGHEAAKMAADLVKRSNASEIEVINGINKKASDDAADYVEFLKGFQEGQVKKSMHGMKDEEGAEDKGESHDDEDNDEEEAAEDYGGDGEMDAESAMEDMVGDEGAPAGPPAPPMPPEAAMGGMPPEAAMGGMPPEAAMGGMPPEAAMGGMPPEAAMGGMPPEAAMGGMPPGAMGGAPGMPPGMTEEEIMMALQQALAGAGAPPGAMKAAGQKVVDARQRDGQRKQAEAHKQASANALQSFFRSQITELMASEPVEAK